MPTRALTVTSVVVAGLGHIGLSLAHDAIRSGHQTVGLEPRPDRITKLIDELAPADPPTAVLRDALGSGQWRITSDPGEAGPFDIAVVAPGVAAVDAATRDPVEIAAGVLAAHLRPGGLVVVATTVQPARRGELFAATVELLTGRRAGRDYALGFGLSYPGTTGTGGVDATVVSGVDAASARRTADFYDGLGRSTAIVAPVEAAELVALLQQALRDRAG